MKTNWKSWFRRGRWEERMDAEFRFHLDNLIADFVREGMSREEAERRARREFGAIDLAKDECRDERTTDWLYQVGRDLRYALRALWRSPGFTAAAVLTFALGIGANTASFSVVQAVLMKPLPYQSPEQIYSVEVVIPERVSQFASLPVTIQAYREWRKAETVFSDMTALRQWECNVTGWGEPELLGGARVSTNFFSFLGVPVVRGRGFTAAEEMPGNEMVVVISDGLWRRRYGADPSLVGKSISINGQNHQVVGIASPSLLVPAQLQLHPVLKFAARVDIWKPIAPSQRELESESWDHGVFVRLRPGVDAERGRQQLQTILNAMIRAMAPEIKTEFQTKLVPIREVYAGRVRLALLLILAAAGLLLLTACANIANLFLARAASRASEFATRIALGAGRSRIMSQMLAETAVVSAAGGLVGAAVASYGAGLLAAYGPDDIRLLAGAGMNVQVFLFALAASVVTGAACGVLPAWQVCRRDTAQGMQEGARSAAGGFRGTQARRVLVGVQMALGTALLASAGLLLHSFANMLGADRGYEVERVLAAELSLFGPRQDPAGFYGQLAERVRALPGVQAAGVINDLPAVSILSGANQTIFHATDTDFQSQVLQRPTAMIRSVTPGYFAASGTALQAGRHFGSVEPAPVALISESLAARLWQRESPGSVIGRTIRQGNVTGTIITVVGVVRDVRPGAMDREMPPLIYRPYPQWASGTATLVVRTAQEPSGMAAAVRAEIRKLNPNLPIPAVRTMKEIVSASVAQRRFQITLTSLFALAALLLGAVGVYGVVSYAVACRTRDIGLRMALGAERRDVLRWVFVSGMQPVAMGLVVGLAGAIAIAASLRSLLYGIGPADPLSLGAVVVTLLTASGLACYLPARRAARLDPMRALRHE